MGSVRIIFYLKALVNICVICNVLSKEVDILLKIQNLVKQPKTIELQFVIIIIIRRNNLIFIIVFEFHKTGCIQ